MATHAEIAAKLLRDAASFFRTLGAENPALDEQMQDNATVFDQVTASAAERPVGIVANLTARDIGHLLVQDGGERAQDAALCLSAKAEEDEVLP